MSTKREKLLKRLDECRNDPNYDQTDIDNCFFGENRNRSRTRIFEIIEDFELEFFEFSAIFEGKNTLDQIESLINQFAPE